MEKLSFNLSGSVFEINKLALIFIQLVSAVCFAIGLGNSNGQILLISYAVAGVILNEIIFISIAKAYLIKSVKGVLGPLFVMWIIQIASTVLLFWMSDVKKDALTYWTAFFCFFVFTLLFAISIFLWIKDNPNLPQATANSLPSAFEKWPWPKQGMIIVAIGGMSLCFGYQARQCFRLAACAPKYAEISFLKGSLECEGNDKGQEAR